jgi:hypothetical protein
LTLGYYLRMGAQCFHAQTDELPLISSASVDNRVTVQ